MTVFKQRKAVWLIVRVAACLAACAGWLAPGTFAGNPVALTDQIVIKVNPTSHVNTPTIFLGDIATITAGSFLIDAIKNIEIGSALKPEKIVVIDKRKIVFQLKSRKYLQGNYTLISPEKVFVKRLGQTIRKQQVEAFIHQRLAETYPDKEYQIQQFTVRGIEPYPQGSISFNIDTQKPVTRKGRLSCYLDVMVNGVNEGRLSISGTIAVVDDIVFAARSLLKGDTLSRDNVYLKKDNIFDYNVAVLHSIDAVDGKVLTKSIRKDTGLIGSDLSDPPLVKKGDIVTIVAENKNLRILATGISMEDGFINELVKVENFRSGKLVRGIVKEKSKVEVVY